MNCVLGVDPGLAAFGWAVVQLHDIPVCVNWGVVRTEPSPKKRKVLASDDNARRVRELAGCLNGFWASPLAKWGVPIAICAESQSWPRSSGASAKIGMAWGALVAVATVHSAPILQATPMQVKRAVCGNGKANKEEVQVGVMKRKIPPWPKRKMDREHVADAFAAAIACWDAEIVAIARRMQPWRNNH